MESDRRLNRWGLTFTPAVSNQLRKLAIFGQPQLSLEHQGKAKRYVVRGVESGGASADMGYYVTFAGENGQAIPWLQTVDSLAVNGPHAIAVSPVLTRIEVLRVRRTYELCITRHRPCAVDARQRPQLMSEEIFRGEHGYLGLELWGKDRDLSGCVRPHFFTRSGEEIDVPLEFDEAIKAATFGVNCVGCAHPHYLRLVAPPTLLAHANGDGHHEKPDVGKSTESAEQQACVAVEATEVSTGFNANVRVS